MRLIASEAWPYFWPRFCFARRSSDLRARCRIQSEQGDLMRKIMYGAWIVAAAFTMSTGGSLSFAQTPAQTPAATTSNSTHSKPAPKKTTRRKTTSQPAQTSPKLQAIPLEAEPPSPPTPPAVAAQQKASDQKLLQQQEQQSAQAAQLTNQQVQQAQKQKDQIQNEVRIQDAPGPGQTGVVPAAGVPVAPVNADQRIQDAPGPAQTLPTLPATSSGQPAPAPQQAPPQI